MTSKERTRLTAGFTHPLIGQRGFTLLELMIVVAIIAVLSLIAIKGYSTFQARAQVSEALNLLGNTKSGVIEYRESTAAWPGTDAAASLNANGVSGKFVESVHMDAGGAIVATFRPGSPVTSALQGKKLALGFAQHGSNAADAQDGYISFCGYSSNDPGGATGPYVFGTTDPATLTTAPSDLLPAACKS